MNFNPKTDMRDYFAGRIAWHTDGMLAGHLPGVPNGVKRVHGDVTSSQIEVEMSNGDVYLYSGGRYAARKVRLCYPPLMPKFVCKLDSLSKTC